MSNTLLWNLIVSFVFAALRVSGEKSPVFQALAHVYVGGLFVYAYQARFPSFNVWWDRDRSFWRLAWALSFVELGKAIYDHHDKLARLLGF
jgi:hypothetical protein